MIFRYDFNEDRECRAYGSYVSSDVLCPQSVGTGYGDSLFQEPYGGFDAGKVGWTCFAKRTINPQYTNS